MSVLLIACDLAVSSRASGPLAVAIMRSGARWARPLETVWYVETERSPADLEAELLPLLGDDDALLVQEAGEGRAVTNSVLRWTPASRSARDAAVSGDPDGTVVRLRPLVTNISVAA